MTIVVGIDGSDGSATALRWALARTETFGPVQPVLAWRYPWWGYSAPIPAPISGFRERAEALAAETLSKFPVDRCLSPIVTRGDAGPVLTEIGATAGLVVVGTRGRNALADGLLGSVSTHVVAHSRVPVAVVPSGASLDDGHGRAVVGVDGSDNAMAALRWAVDHLPATTTVEATHCWAYPVGIAVEPGPMPPSCEWYEQGASRLLQNALEAVSPPTEAGTDGAGRVVARLEYGDARGLLSKVSASADALVLGARGRTGPAHLLMGSVTSALVHQPSTTTVVVPSP